MNETVTRFEIAEFVNELREVQEYSYGTFSNIFATTLIVAAIVLLH